jgi:NitT/TauT family transport system substrate-binding protein
MVQCCCRFARVGSLLIGSLGAATAAGAQDISVSAFSFGLFGDGDVAATITQTMSGQVDVGWSVAPFMLDALAKGEVRIIARASDLEAARRQTVRVQIINAQNLAAKSEAVGRYLKAYNETIDWMYSGPDEVQRYIAFSGLSESSVRHMLADFIPNESLQTKTIAGIAESVQDAVQFKFLPAPPSQDQLSELIRIPAGS